MPTTTSRSWQFRLNTNTSTHPLPTAPLHPSIRTIIFNPHTRHGYIELHGSKSAHHIRAHLPRHCLTSLQPRPRHLSRDQILANLNPNVILLGAPWHTGGQGARTDLPDPPPPPTTTQHHPPLAFPG